MAHLATDDLELLATRFRLGIPLAGFDGRAIPLRDPDGIEVHVLDAAYELLESGAALLPDAEGESILVRAAARARAVEDTAIREGQGGSVAIAKSAAVLVSAAVRAAVSARAALASPTELNGATLAWYQIHDRRRRDLIAASDAIHADRLSA